MKSIRQSRLACFGLNRAHALIVKRQVSVAPIFFIIKYIIDWLVAQVVVAGYIYAIMVNRIYFTIDSGRLNY